MKKKSQEFKESFIMFDLIKFQDWLGAEFRRSDMGCYLVQLKNG